jgi:hypothetical protein
LYGDDILEYDFINQLNWLKSEFDFLFRFKKHKLNEKDISLAHKIIDKFIESLDVAEDDKLLDLLSDTLESLELEYPELF